MAVELLQGAAALYLAAAVTGALGLALPAPRAARGAAWLLGAGAALNFYAFSYFHRSAPPVPLTDLAGAVALMAFAGVLFYLILLRYARILGLAPLVAPLAFVSVFYAALRIGQASGPTTPGAGSWPHAHILLASAGFACLGLSGLAGLLYLGESRRLKAKRPLGTRRLLPSLEALDRVNRAALGLGFPLLTLGVVSGALWLATEAGRVFSGSAHELWTLAGWLVYAGVTFLRFARPQGARQAAATAVAGSVFLLFAVVGVGLFDQ